jgi:hypothetical protein
VLLGVALPRSPETVMFVPDGKSTCELTVRMSRLFASGDGVLCAIRLKVKPAMSSGRELTSAGELALVGAISLLP